MGGFVDPSFNGFGWSEGPFRGENERLASSAENTQGILVAVGSQGSGSPQCIVVRYRDSAFSGASTLPLPGLSLVFCSKVLALPDGSFRILGTGLQANGQYSALIIGLTPNGLLDTNFQDQGMRVLNADFSWRESTEQTLLNSGTLDAQGRLLAVGRVLNSANSTSRGLIVRLLGDGNLDSKHRYCDTYFAFYKKLTEVRTPTNIKEQHMLSPILVTGASGFVAIHTIIQLLHQGYNVRSTMRTLEREADLRNTISKYIQANDRLEILPADLSQDSGWEEALNSVEYVLHVASPFPLYEPKHEDELIVPAVQGTLRVLRAAHKAGVKRVVQVSSVAAISSGYNGENKTFTTTARWPALVGFILMTAMIYAASPERFSS